MLSITMVNVCGGFLGFIFIVCNLTLASQQFANRAQLQQHKLANNNSVSSSFIVTKLPSSYHRNQTTAQVLSSVICISNINSQAHFSLFCGQSGGQWLSHQPLIGSRSFEDGKRSVDQSRLSKLGKPLKRTLSFLYQWRLGIADESETTEQKTALRKAEKNHDQVES